MVTYSYRGLATLSLYKGKGCFWYLLCSNQIYSTHGVGKEGESERMNEAHFNIHFLFLFYFIFPVTYGFDFLL